MQLESAVPKAKSFFERKEGLAGMVFGLLGLGALGIGFMHILPTLIALASGTLTLLALCVAIGAIVMVLLDGRLPKIAWAMYQSLMRLITGIFVEIDPVGICKNYIKQLQKKRENIGKEMENLKAQQKSIEAALDDADEKKTECLQLAKQAEKKGMQNEVDLNALEAQRQQEFITKMQFILEKIKMLYGMLDRVEENCEVIIKDTTNQVNAKERERAMWKSIGIDADYLFTSTDGSARAKMRLRSADGRLFLITGDHSEEYPKGNIHPNTFEYPLTEITMGGGGASGG